MRKRRGFHLWKNIKKAIGKVGTLNLVLILMFAFSEMEEMNDES